MGLDRRAPLVLGLWLSLVVGCGDPALRSSLVPLAVPPPPADLEAIVGLPLAASGLTHAQGEGQEARGLFLPRLELHGAVDLAVPRYAVRGLYRTFLASSVALSDAGFPRPDRAGHAAGWGHVVRISPLGRRWALDLEWDRLFVKVPSRRCTREPLSECVAADFVLVREDASIYALSVLWSYRREAGPRGMVSATLQSQLAHEADGEIVPLGRPNFVLGGGAAVPVAARLELMAMLHLPVTAHPVRYAPVLTFVLRVHSRERGQAADQ